MTTKEYYAREFPVYESFEGFPEGTPDGIHLKDLYEELIYDVKNVLPTKSYVGNCSKEFVKKIIDIYGEDEFMRIQSIDFPDTREYPITDEQCEREMKTLLESNKDKKSVSLIIKKWHPSINLAHRQGCLSPYEGWQAIKSDYKKFLSFYENRLRCSDWFKEKDNVKFLIQGYVPEFIYGIGLSTSRKYPQVSYFKPHLAKYIVSKYLGDYDCVFDPFAGYCGRMLGVIACGKEYNGQDLCESTVSELCDVYVNVVEPYLKKNDYPLVGMSIDCVDSTAETGVYECLFTCPPYGMLEQWPGVDLQKRSCDEWIDVCLNNYRCDKYVFVVDDTVDKYKDFIVETLENTSHFGRNNEYIVVINGEDRKSLGFNYDPS